MKKNILVALAILFISSTTFAQSHVAMAKKGDLWGYIGNNGQWVIQTQYAKCFHFSNGYAAVYDKIRREHYFIDADNQEVLSQNGPYLVKGGGAFSDGMAIIVKRKKFGAINTSGDIVVPAEYAKISAYKEGMAAAKVGKDCFLLDKSGNEIPVEDAIDIKAFAEGLAPFRGRNKLFGFIGKDGKVVIEPTFQSVGYFSGGIAWAKVNDRVGYIDKTGSWVIQPTYLAAKPFGKLSKLARVKPGEYWVFIDQNGAEVEVVRADRYDDYSEGFAKVKIGERWGFMDVNGKLAIDAQFQNVRDFKNGYAAVRIDDLWGVINTAGEWVIQPELRGIKDMYPLAP